MKPAIRDIVRIVAAYYGLHPDALAGPIMLPKVVKARQVAMHLARRRGFKLAEIGAALGRRQQSTVTRGDRKIAAAHSSDRRLAGDLRDLDTLISSAAAVRRIAPPGRAEAA